MSVFVWVPGQIPPDRFRDAVGVSVRRGALLVNAPESAGYDGPMFVYPKGGWTKARYPGAGGETIEVAPPEVAVPRARRSRLRDKAS